MRMRMRMKMKMKMSIEKKDGKDKKTFKLENLLVLYAAGSKLIPD